MMRMMLVLFFVFLAVSIYSQTKKDIEYALSEIAKPLGGVVNDAILQDANTLGGLPHFRVTAGINLRTVSFRDPEIPDSMKEWTAGAISIEGRVGLFGGKSLGPTLGGFGSTDLLLRLAFYPMGDEDSTAFVPLFGVGLKIGVLRESLTTPAVSLTMQYTASSIFALKDDVNETYAEFTMKVFSLHADVSKNLLIINPYVGVGFNVNSMGADIWHSAGFQRIHDTYSVSPIAAKFYAGVNKQIFVIGLNAEVGLSGETLYWAIGLSGGM